MTAIGLSPIALTLGPVLLEAVLESSFAAC